MRRFISFFIMALCCATCLAAPRVQVVGLFPGAAVLNVDGKRQLVRVGQTGPGGVEVLSADSRGAVLRVDGVEGQYSLSREYTGNDFVVPEKQRISIARGDGGHYWASGAINGQSVQFLVDTGATAIAMNESQAKYLGIDYRAQGSAVRVNTAAGSAHGWSLTLDRVSVGALQVLGVKAIVLQGDSPRETLLGMSFLNQVGWRVEQNVLVLESRL